jgi:hypothetical protein
VLTASGRPDPVTAQCVIFENPADLYRVADAVFVGTVSATQLTGARGSHVDVEIGTIRVERSWKAPQPAEVRVGNDQPWVVGKQYIVFAGGKVLSTSTQCDWAEPTENAKTKLDWLFRTVKLIDIYSLMLRLSYHGGLGLSPIPVDWAVHSEGIPMPTLRGASKEWLANFDGMPTELRRFLMEQEPARPHAIDQSMLPSGTQLVPAGTKVQPGTPRTIALSSVLYTREGLDALVYYGANCGGLCAEAGYAWLRRANHQALWQLSKRIVRRVS